MLKYILYVNISEGGKTMKKLIALMTTAVLATSMVSSCGKAANSSSGHHWQNSETLNEWQKSLLKAEGLPTDIEQLSPSQKRSIQHIYEMITYLNEKYDEEFVYAGYVEPGVMDEETLYARSLSDEKQSAVTVKIDSNGDFTDDYYSVGIRDYCEKLYNDFIKGYFNSDKAVIFIDNFDCKINNLNEIKNDNFENKVGGCNNIFISSKICTEKEFEDFIADYYRWCDKHELVLTNRITLIDIGDFSNINYLNYTDYYKRELFLADYILNLYGNHEYTTTLEKKLEELGKNN
jgi:hypothetical protein